MRVFNKEWWSTSPTDTEMAWLAGFLSGAFMALAVMVVAVVLVSFPGAN